MILLPNIQKPNCFNCGLNAKLVKGSGTTNGFMIIGEYPNDQEAVKRQSLIGWAPGLLVNALKQVGIQRSDFWFTYVALCKPPQKERPCENDIAMCNGRLISEIELVKPHTVLLLGEISCQAILGMKLKDCEGRRIYKDGRTYIATYSPNSFFKDSSKFRDFITSIKKLTSKKVDFKWNENYNVATCKEDITNWYKSVPLNQLISIDIETYGKNVRTGMLHSIGLMYPNSDVFIIPVELCEEEVISRMFNYLSVTNHCTFIAHNADFEFSWIKSLYDIDLPFTEDTFLHHYNGDERGGEDEDFASSKGIHKLKTIVSKYLDCEDWSIDLKNVFEHDKWKVYEYLNKDVQANYVALEKCKTLSQKLSPYKNILIPAIPVISHINNTGLRIDTPVLEKMKVEWEQRIEDYKSQFNSLAGKSINIDSPKQVSELFYNEMGLENRFKGSVNEEAIKFLSKEYPENNILGVYNDIIKQTKVLSTYINGILNNMVDGRIYSQFNLTIAETGRLSSRYINLQNIPARGIGRDIRKVFLADPGYEFVDNDFKQLEYRVIAATSKDPISIEYINNKKDIHREVASLFFGLSLEDIDRDTELEDAGNNYRYNAKNKIVFATLYLQTLDALAKSFGISPNQAEKQMASVYPLIAGIQNWVDEVIGFVEEKHYVETVFGRRRRFPLIYSGNRNKVHRQAVNAMIQPTASDICLMGFTEIHKTLMSKGVIPSITVHDSVLNQIPKGERHLIEDIKACLERPRFESPVKFEVDCKIGDNWGEMSKYNG